jgi:hypothetical protein
MSPEEAVARVRKAGHIVIRHRGDIFFNTTDHDEMRRWEKLGSRIVPHYELDEIEHRKKKGKRTVPGWEVHMLGAVSKVIDHDEAGDEVDITKDALLAAARA